LLIPELKGRPVVNHDSSFYIVSGSFLTYQLDKDNNHAIVVQISEEEKYVTEIQEYQHIEIPRNENIIKWLTEDTNDLYSFTFDGERREEIIKTLGICKYKNFFIKQKQAIPPDYWWIENYNNEECKEKVKSLFIETMKVKNHIKETKKFNDCAQAMTNDNIYIIMGNKIINYHCKEDRIDYTASLLDSSKDIDGSHSLRNPLLCEEEKSLLVLDNIYGRKIMNKIDLESGKIVKTFDVNKNIRRIMHKSKNGQMEKELMLFGLTDTEVLTYDLKADIIDKCVYRYCSLIV